MSSPSRIGKTPFLTIVPASIADDEGIRHIAGVLDAPLSGVVRSVPRLLLWARLNPDPALLSALMQRLAEAAGGLAPFSEAELELLAWQFHVDFRETAKTPEQLAEMVGRSIPWHRIKGTPASIRAALALYGIDAGIEEGGRHWAEYQLGLRGVADLDAVRTAVRVAREMAPVRCRLFRVYNAEFDMRPIVLSEGPALGDGFLSHYSGVGVDDGAGGDVQVSFGTVKRMRAEAYLASDMSASFGVENRMVTLAPYLDRFVLGRSRLSDRLPRNNPFVVGALVNFLWADRQTVARAWNGAWDDRRWSDVTGFDRRLARWRMAHRALSRSQLAPADSALADTNSRLGATFAVVIDSPPRLGSFALSGHDCKRQERRLHEMAIVTQGTETPRLDPPAPQAAGGAWLASCPPIPNPERVRQAGLGETALGLEPLAWSSPETAGTAELSSIGEAVEPPEPSAALVSYQAPLWSGSWAAGRTWNTSPQLSIQ